MSKHRRPTAAALGGMTLAAAVLPRLGGTASAETTDCQQPRAEAVEALGSAPHRPGPDHAGGGPHDPVRAGDPAAGDQGRTATFGLRTTFG